MNNHPVNITVSPVNVTSDRRHVLIRCPYCGRRHWHQSPDTASRFYRAPCAASAGGGYTINTPEIDQ